MPSGMASLSISPCAIRGRMLSPRNVISQWPRKKAWNFSTARRPTDACDASMSQSCTACKRMRPDPEHRDVRKQGTARLHRCGVGSRDHRHQTRLLGEDDTIAGAVPYRLRRGRVGGFCDDDGTGGARCGSGDGNRGIENSWLISLTSSANPCGEVVRLARIVIRLDGSSWSGG